MMNSIDSVGAAAATTGAAVPVAKPEPAPAAGADPMKFRAEPADSKAWINTQAEGLVTLEPSRRAFKRIFRDEPWEANVRQKLDAHEKVDDQQLSQYRTRQNEKLLLLQMAVQNIQFEMEFASKLAEHGASAGKTVLQTQL